MKKYMLPLIFSLCVISASVRGQNPDKPLPEPPKEEKAKSNTALWISLGVVFFCVFIALNAKKMKKHKE